jgi:hypothetical protein
MRSGSCSAANSANAREKVASLAFAAAFPAAQPAQTGIAVQPVEQSARGRQVEHHLGDEGAGDGAPILARSAAAAAGRRHERFEAEQVQTDHQLLMLARQRPQFFPQPGKQRRLNVTPPPQQTKIVFGQCYTKSQTAITSRIYKLSIRKIYLKKNNNCHL